MKSYIKVLVVAISLFVSSCGDPEHNMNFRYINESSHTIDIEFSFNYHSFQLYDNLTLLPGDTVVGYASFMGKNPKTPYNVSTVYNKADVCYDGQYVISHHAYKEDQSFVDIDRNICISNSHKITRSDHGYTYTYTFTDADYEYAVENGQRVTEE